MICDCYKTGKQKIVQNDNNQKECLTSGKNKTSLSPSGLIKHTIKLIISKLAYWPVQIAIANQKSSKAIIPT